MNPALTWYELFAILGLTAFLCAPAIKKLFHPEIQRALRRISGRRAARVEAREEKTQSKAAVHELGDQTSRASARGTARPDALRIALTRSCADALLATLQDGPAGVTQSRGRVDPKIAEALRPGCRTITLEVDDSPLPFETESPGESGAPGQRLFVVQSGAAGEVRVSSPWEYMSNPQSGRRKPVPATIWSAHNGFLGRPTSATTPSSVAATKAPAEDHRWTPKPAARRA
jgi:hypothetical protein